MYKVIKSFTDIQDNGYKYKEGDVYPRNGLEVLPSRIKELSTNSNRRKEPMIKEVSEPKKRTSKRDE